MSDMASTVVHVVDANQQFAPENRPSQKEASIPTIQFQVRAVGMFS